MVRIAFHFFFLTISNDYYCFWSHFLNDPSSPVAVIQNSRVLKFHGCDIKLHKRKCLTLALQTQSPCILLAGAVLCKLVLLYDVHFFFFQAYCRTVCKHLLKLCCFRNLNTLLLNVIESLRFLLILVTSQW